MPRTVADRRRDNNLVAVLAVATGALDAISFLGLGGVFTSVMTANMVLLGLSAGTRDGALALHAGAALTGFVVGGLAASRFARPADQPARVWPVRVTVMLAVEAAVLAGVTAGWEAAAARPSGPEQLVLVTGAAVAMGIQSAAVRALGVPGLSTTYLTGTLTAVLGDLAAARGSASLRRRVVLLIMLVAGAAVSGVLVTQAPRLAPLIPLALLAGVIATAIFASP